MLALQVDSSVGGASRFSPQEPSEDRSEKPSLSKDLLVQLGGRWSYARAMGEAKVFHPRKFPTERGRGQKPSTSERERGKPSPAWTERWEEGGADYSQSTFSWKALASCISHEQKLSCLNRRLIFQSFSIHAAKQEANKASARASSAQNALRCWCFRKLREGGAGVQVGY